MEKVVCLNKPRSLTPLEMITAFKKEYPEYAAETISYAGRLDPMAEGLLILLIGDENKRRGYYENFEKTYSFTVLFGIETDSYDSLGKIQKSAKPPPSTQELIKKLNLLIPTFLGVQEQIYPPYSSFQVNGKPLFYWARENKLNEVTIPKRKIVIKELLLRDVKNVYLSEYVPRLIKDIVRVKGDFRQKEIVQGWQNFLLTNPHHSYPLASFTVSCSSGTYVRSLAHTMGRSLGCGALADNIIRIKVGDYTSSQALPLTSFNQK